MRYVNKFPVMSLPSSGAEEAWKRKDHIPSAPLCSLLREFSRLSPPYEESLLVRGVIGQVE